MLTSFKVLRRFASFIRHLFIEVVAKMFDFLKRVEIKSCPDHQWLERVMKLNRKSALMLGNVLVIQSFKYQRRNFISMTPGLLNEFQIHRATAFRGLKLLEAAGLVAVQRKRGVCPSVSIVEVGTKNPEELNSDDNGGLEKPDDTEFKKANLRKGPLAEIDDRTSGIYGPQAFGGAIEPT